VVTRPGGCRFALVGELGFALVSGFRVRVSPAVVVAVGAAFFVAGAGAVSERTLTSCPNYSFASRISTSRISCAIADHVIATGTFHSVRPAEIFVAADPHQWRCQEEQGFNGSTAPGRRGLYECGFLKIHGTTASPAGSITFVG
jgi:hypothetical protein